MQTGIVLDQVPIQSLAQVTSQIFLKGTQLSASHMGVPLFFIYTQDMAHFLGKKWILGPGTGQVPQTALSRVITRTDMEGN